MRLRFFTLPVLSILLNFLSNDFFIWLTTNSHSWSSQSIDSTSASSEALAAMLSLASSEQDSTSSELSVETPPAEVEAPPSSDLLWFSCCDGGWGAGGGWFPDLSKDDKSLYFTCYYIIFNLPSMSISKSSIISSSWSIIGMCGSANKISKIIFHEYLIIVIKS